MGVHRDVLKLIRCFEQAKAEEQKSAQVITWEQVEINVIKRYMSWILNEKNKYPTTLEADKGLLKLVERETPNGRFHWMYQFVLTYRIGQKEILDYQLYQCRLILEKLNQCGGDKSRFAESTADLCRWSNSLTDYFQDDLQCFRKEQH